MALDYDTRVFLWTLQPHLWGTVNPCSECAFKKSVITPACCFVSGPVRFVDIPDWLQGSSTSAIKLLWPGHPHEGHVCGIHVDPITEILTPAYVLTEQALVSNQGNPWSCMQCENGAPLALKLGPPKHAWLLVDRDAADTALTYASVYLAACAPGDVAALPHVGHQLGMLMRRDLEHATLVDSPIVKPMSSPKIALDAMQLEKLRQRACFGDIVARRKLTTLGVCQWLGHSGTCICHEGAP